MDHVTEDPDTIITDTIYFICPSSTFAASSIAAEIPAGFLPPACAILAGNLIKGIAGLVGGGGGGRPNMAQAGGKNIIAGNHTADNLKNSSNRFCSASSQTLFLLKW